MQAYLQQYSLYPPFINGRNRRHCDLFVVCRFKSLVLFRKFLFRWSKVIDSKYQIELFALFYEDEYGFDQNDLNERAIKKEAELILNQKRFTFIVNPIFFGVKDDPSHNKAMDLKLLGDEVCFQVLKRRRKKLHFLWTSAYTIPALGLFTELMKLKKKVSFYAEKIHLPEVSFEFPESVINDARSKWSDQISLKDNSPHLFFSTDTYIELYGKSPCTENLNKLSESGGSKLEEYLFLDTDYAY